LDVCIPALATGDDATKNDAVVHFIVAPKSGPSRWLVALKYDEGGSTILLANGRARPTMPANLYG
jgi:hypothetical protein